ncbi:MAG: plasmid maintenance system killer family protein [Chlorobiaceae bacterium]|nr:plasmid maintenance system killer family protein [Chlorobiaceae bacterium]
MQYLFGNIEIKINGNSSIMLRLVSAPQRTPVLFRYAAPIPPANRLEKLSGGYKDFYSIRINDQWRIIFKWAEGNAFEAEIIDYH